MNENYTLKKVYKNIMLIITISFLLMTNVMSIFRLSGIENELITVKKEVLRMKGQQDEIKRYKELNEVYKVKLTDSYIQLDSLQNNFDSLNNEHVKLLSKKIKLSWGLNSYIIDNGKAININKLNDDMKGFKYKVNGNYFNDFNMNFSKHQY